MKIRNIVTDQESLTVPTKAIHTNEWKKIFGILEANFKAGKMSGLTAIQIGINKSAFVILFNEFVTFKQFANAKIISHSAEVDETEEKCLSIPGKKFAVTRYKSIVVQDDMRGRSSYSGKEARIVQHEIDHCNGVTIMQIGKLIQ